MKPLTTATLNWFDDGCCDVKYLDIWHNVPLNFQPSMAATGEWERNHYKCVLGRDESGMLFQTAADRLMQYQFYPDDVMVHYGDFDLEERRARMGDRIIQRIRILRPFGWPVLDAVTMTEITAVVDEPRRVGFTYATTASHATQGEWTALLHWRDDNSVVLTIDAVSRPNPEEPARNHSFMRRLQQRAHRRGLEHFARLITTQQQEQVPNHR